MRLSSVGPGALTFFLLYPLIATNVNATLVNRTIDDTLGDSVTLSHPKYRPDTSGVWEGADCTGCAIQPDKAFASNGTWTAATYNPGLGSMSVELEFTGEPNAKSKYHSLGF